MSEKEFISNPSDNSSNSYSLITSSLTLEEKKLFKKYIEEYNDLYQKILILSQNEFISKLTQYVEYSLRLKCYKFSLKSKEKIKEIISDKIYKNDYILAQKIKTELIKEKKIFNEEEILPHCDKDKKSGNYIHICDNPFLVYKYNDNKIFLFCEKCNLIYKDSLIKFKCNETNIDFYSKIIFKDNKNNINEDELPLATWSKYHCNAVINDLMKCQKCSNKLYLVKKSYKKYEKKYIFCKKCKKLWYPTQINWECLICKKLFTCDVKAYNPLEFKTIKICIKDAIINKIRAKPKYLECDCKFNFDETIFFHKNSCKGELFFGELNSKKTVICEKCDSIGFYDGYVWTCPLCLKKTKNKKENKENEENKVNNDNKENKNIDKKDSISMNKIPLRKKYKMMKDNLSTNNIKNKNKENSKENDKEEKNKTLDKSEDNFSVKNNNILSKHRFSFSKKNREYSINDNNNNNELTKEKEKEKSIDKNNNNNLEYDNKYQKLKKYLSVIDTENANIKDLKNIIKKSINTQNSNLKSSALNKPSRNHNSILKQNLTNSNTNENNINFQNMNIKRKNSFMSKFNKYKITSKLLRISSGKNIDNNNEDNNIYQIVDNKDDISQKNIRRNKIFHRYKNIYNNDRNKRDLDINLSKDFKTELNEKVHKENNKNMISNLLINNEKDKEQNVDNYYNNKKGSNSTADNSDNTTKIIYHVKNPKQSFQIKKINKNMINLDDYKIIKKIGQGSFGQIFEIEDNYKNKFALKKIILTQESDIKKIEHEYQILMDLNSSKNNLNLNLIKIYGYYSKQLDPTTFVIYVLMELAITDWEQQILFFQRRKNYYTEQNLMKILFSLIKTFSQLQKNNISHRDIKPQNILIFENNIYKLADFGEAKELYKDIEATNKQTLRGTELYMAPILFQALRSNKMIKYIKHNTYKSDVFSFGLCALFAASLCFESVYDVREAKNNVKIRFILEKYLGKRYSFDVINIIAQMLDINEITRKDFIEIEKEFNVLGYE